MKTLEAAILCPIILILFLCASALLIRCAEAAVRYCENSRAQLLARQRLTA